MNVTTTLPHRHLPSEVRPSELDTTEYGDLFLSVVDSTGAALAVVDPLLRIQHNNEAFVDHCGQPADALVGRNICDLLHPSIRQQTVRQFDRLIQRRCNTFVEHLAALWATQTAYTATVTGIAVHDPIGQVENIIVLVNPTKSDSERRVLTSPTKLLSEIDAQILEGVATGAPTVQLACRLYLSRQGVEYHISNMLRQFKVPNRAALVSKAYSMGLFRIGSWPPKVIGDYIRP